MEGVGREGFRDANYICSRGGGGMEDVCVKVERSRFPKR